jgi:hypothetical protein
MSEEVLEQEEKFEVINTPQFKEAFDRLISKVENIDDYRVASSVIYGYYKDWSAKKICAYYSISDSDYEKYSNLFNFKERRENNMAGRKSKQDNIINFLNGNVGKVVTPVQIAQDVDISLPTFYNFYNANRGYFKKIKRGHFEILDPKTERQNG